MNKIFIQAYGNEVEVPVIVISGDTDKIVQIAKLFEALGVDKKYALTVNSEDEIEAFKDFYAVFFANKFEPTVEFVKSHQDLLFISTTPQPCGSYIVTGIPIPYADCSNRMWTDMMADAPVLHEKLNRLAEFTGISAFRNLQYDDVSKLWVHVGKASLLVQHTTKDLAGRFAKESIKWVAAGKPYRNQPAINALFDRFCSKCSEYIPKPRHHDTGKCNQCGCGISKKIAILNKLAWGTTECPAGKWTADIAVDEKTIVGKEHELFQEYLKIQKELNPDGQGKICDCN
jgi:hypothetical protein